FLALELIRQARLVELDELSTMRKGRRIAATLGASMVRDREILRGSGVVTSPTDRQPKAVRGISSALPAEDQGQNQRARSRSAPRREGAPRVRCVAARQAFGRWTASIAAASLSRALQDLDGLS